MATVDLVGRRATWGLTVMAQTCEPVVPVVGWPVTSAAAADLDREVVAETSECGLG